MDLYDVTNGDKDPFASRPMEVCAARWRSDELRLAGASFRHTWRDRSAAVIIAVDGATNK
jgi:hypothetical protein